ncbi:MAG: hypothetical protein ACRDSK_26770 [Actinophytocola sp.]|uniref:hypothetical protein n=1 Tax=Actinophytocola sp. TaxID=1872138 RepID=UPI003D6A5A54
MALPPGREPIPVQGITADSNPRLAEVSGELAAWIDYLLHPESHDGPRVYRPTAAQGDEAGADVELPWSDVTFEDEGRFATISVLEDYMYDTSVFFTAAQSVSGVRSDVMETAFDKLTQGVLTWDKDGRAHAPAEQDGDDAGKGEKERPPPATKYAELFSVRSDWAQMRKTWTAPEDNLAQQYESDFLDFQLYTENATYVMAEHLVRYRAIMHRAGEDILALMETLVKLCPRASTAPGATDPGGTSLDVFSIVVTGLVVAATTVLTAGAGGVTAAVVLGSAAVEMAGEAVKTAEEKKAPKQRLLLEDKMYLRDVVPQYLDGVNKIERDVAEAVLDLRDNLRRELDGLRQTRQYPVNGVGPETGAVPQIDDYKLIT